jgi:hypothetical protein
MWFPWENKIQYCHWLKWLHVQVIFCWDLGKFKMAIILGQNYSMGGTYRNTKGKHFYVKYFDVYELPFFCVSIRSPRWQPWQDKFNIKHWGKY